jgi:nucleoside triphosphate pyrophosphatase
VRLALAKAEAVLQLSCQGVASRSIVIGCDTVVALDGEVLGKPADGIEATAVLQRLRGRAHEVYSAVAVLNGAASASAVIEVARTFVRMRCYCDTEVAAYVATGDPLDKAGAYAIQNAEFQPVSECLGCYTNVMGLPLCHLARSLHAWSVELANDVPRACQVHTHRLCTVYNDILRD